MNYEILFTFSLATAVLALSPGPDNIFVLIQSVTHGKRYGFSTIAGLMTGCLIHTSLLAFGVSAVIKNNPMIFTGIKIFGALYLLYLAWSVFRADHSIALDAEGVEKKSLLRLFRQGFIMNVLNPKVTIFFLAFFPGFLFSDELSTVVQFYVLGLLFICVSSLVFGGFALLAGTIAVYTKKNTNTGLVLKWLQILVFSGIAIFLVTG
ncbi:LysE family translocator [Maribacter chungangensis]|uniref:LysE family translocator n=1 Tax=Maribacter chungangensis TaxID=1069117 RepID=A0ABW3B264_9FLAO